MIPGTFIYRMVQGLNREELGILQDACRSRMLELELEQFEARQEELLRDGIKFMIPAKRDSKLIMTLRMALGISVTLAHYIVTQRVTSEGFVYLPTDSLKFFEGEAS